MRVKILFQKKSSALVQMHDGNQAQLGIYTNHTLTGCRQNGPPLPPKRPAFAAKTASRCDVTTHRHSQECVSIACARSIGTGLLFIYIFCFLQILHTTCR